MYTEPSTCLREKFNSVVLGWIKKNTGHYYKEHGKQNKGAHSLGKSCATLGFIDPL